MKNPKAAVDSILSPSVEVAGFVVHPVSIGRYALLELAGSPFLDPEKTFSISNIVPTLFIMTCSNEELGKYNSGNVDRLVEEAYKWSNDVPMDAIAGILKETQNQFELIGKVSPSNSGSDSNSKKN